jgi:photosystem II stability/assembly factor-like uncharacterized protein
MRRLPLVLFALALGLTSGCTRSPATAPSAPAPALQSVVLDTLTTDALWIGLSVTPGGDVWMGGTGGAAAVRPVGGAWRVLNVPGADTLQFRDAHAFSAREAVLLSIGSGTASRVFRTTDGGTSWQTTWTNPDADAFYDCLAFWPDRPDVGFAFSDAVPAAGGFAVPIVRTTDRGATWTRVDAARVPAAREGEGGYASSGACAVAGPGGEGWIVTNGGPAPNDQDRLLATTDYGQTWTARPVPIGSPEGGLGLSTAAWAGDVRFVGLLGAIDGTVVLRSSDGGFEWQALEGVGVEQVYGLAAQRHNGRVALAATGPGGLSASADGGASWRLLTGAELWTVAPHPDGGFLAAGRGGVVARVR